MEDLIRKLYRCRAIRFAAKGEHFTFRGGIESPIYIDLRVTISFPSILKKLIGAYAEKVLETDFVAGVPMGGIHLATGIALNLHRPMLMPRSRQKGHGLKNKVEGQFRKNQTVCLIEDIMTTGGSALQTVKTLKEADLRINQVVSFLWYFPSGELKAISGLRITSLTTIGRILETLHSYRAISRDVWFGTLSKFRRRSFSPLIKFPQILRDLVQQKRSLLVVALDTTWVRAQELIPLLAPHVCAFKCHYDLWISDPTFSPLGLMRLAKRHGVLIIRDRKCADVSKLNQTIIGPEGRDQDITIVHALPGIISFPKGPLIVVLEMSTTDSLFSPNYMRKVMKLTAGLPNVLGYVSQYKWWPNPGGALRKSHKLCFTPGIDINPRIEGNTAQRYSSPAEKRSHGSDLFIVGSAIVRNRDPLAMVKLYQKETWNPNLDGMAQDFYQRLLKFSQERGLTIEEGKCSLKKLRTLNKNELLPSEKNQGKGRIKKILG